MSGINSLAKWIILIIYPSIICAGPRYMSIHQPPTTDVDIVEDVSNEVKHYICSQNDTASTCHCPEHEHNHDPCAGREPCSHQEESDSILLQKLLLKNDLKLSKPELRDDYVYTPDIGLHKLHTRSVTWNAARMICKEEGGHLAIVNSKAEARVSSPIFINDTFQEFTEYYYYFQSSQLD